DAQHPSDFPRTCVMGFRPAFWIWNPAGQIGVLYPEYMLKIGDEPLATGHYGRSGPNCSISEHYALMATPNDSCRHRRIQEPIFVCCIRSAPTVVWITLPPYFQP